MNVLAPRSYNPRTDYQDRRRYLPNGKHPAKMYVALLLDIVKRYTRPGDTILDPCLGVGTTLCAMLLGRNVLGVELERHHHRDAEANGRRVQGMAQQLGHDPQFQVWRGDARAVVPAMGPAHPFLSAAITSPAYEEAISDGQSAEKAVARIRRKVEAGELGTENPGGVGRRGRWGAGVVTSRATMFGYGMDATVTSPTYVDTASRDRHTEPYAQADPERARYLGQDSPSRNVSGYGKTPGQVGNMSLKDGSYQSAMTAIYAACLDATRDGGLLVAVTGDCIRDHEVVDLAGITVDLAKLAGWTPVERWRANKRSKEGKPSTSYWRLQKARNGGPLIDYEDVLVFVRGTVPGWTFSKLDNGTWPPQG